MAGKGVYALAGVKPGNAKALSAAVTGRAQQTEMAPRVAAAAAFMKAHAHLRSGVVGQGESAAKLTGAKPHVVLSGDLKARDGLETMRSHKANADALAARVAKNEARKGRNDEVRDALNSVRASAGRQTQLQRETHDIGRRAIANSLNHPKEKIPKGVSPSEHLFKSVSGHVDTMRKRRDVDATEARALQSSLAARRAALAPAADTRHQGDLFGGFKPATGPAPAPVKAPRAPKVRSEERNLALIQRLRSRVDASYGTPGAKTAPRLSRLARAASMMKPDTVARGMSAKMPAAPKASKPRAAKRPTLAGANA